MIFHLFCFLFFIFPSVSFSQTPALKGFERLRTEAPLKSQLEAVVVVGLRNSFGEKIPLPEKLPSLFKLPQAVFVTLKKGEEVRGCMGSLKSKTPSLAEEIVQNLAKALFEDPRHRPIRKEELKGMDLFLTAVGDPRPVDRIERISPERDAVLIRSGAKEAVVLPGEAKTLRYLLAFAKAKAGIRKGEPIQVFRIPTVTVSVGLPEGVLTR